MTRFTGEKTLMRIHISESDRYGHKPLFEALIDLFMREGFAGATVLKGISGFGVHAVYHTDKLLELSNDLPVIVEVIASRERIDEVMPSISEMMKGGLITLEKAEVVRYYPENDLQCAMKEQ
jgi:PII-like signaling protein